jgi:hypothetical protein
MTLGALCSPLRWAHIASVVGMPLLFAFFSWRSLWLLAPLPVYLLMSGQEFYLYFHAYYYTFAFVAGYVGLFIFLSRREPADRTALLVLCATSFFNIFAFCSALGFYFQLSAGADEPFSRELREQFAKIPPSATVYGPHRYSVYLSNRDNMVIGDLSEANLDFNAILNARYPETNVRPGQVDYIVSDFLTDQCGWREGFMNDTQHKARSDAIDRLVASGKWARWWQANDVVILQRVAK